MGNKSYLQQHRDAAQKRLEEAIRKTSALIHDLKVLDQQRQSAQLAIDGYDRAIAEGESEIIHPAEKKSKYTWPQYLKASLKSSLTMFTPTELVVYFTENESTRNNNDITIGWLIDHCFKGLRQVEKSSAARFFVEVICEAMAKGLIRVEEDEYEVETLHPVNDGKNHEYLNALLTELSDSLEYESISSRSGSRFPIGVFGPAAHCLRRYRDSLKPASTDNPATVAAIEYSREISHHYEHNRHHPEHFKGESHWREEVAYLKGKMSELSGMVDATTPTQDNDVTIGATVDLLDRQKRELDSSINGMNLFDVLEMLIDWIAAVKRHDDGDISKSMEINRDRFNISPQLWQIMANTLTWLEEIEVPKTQRGLALCVRNQKQVKSR